MRKPYLRIILFILAYSGFLTPSFAQISNASRQDQIIRNQQQIEEEEKRRREFEKIRKEREQLEKQKKQKDEKLEKSQKSSYCFPIKTIEFIGAKSLSKRQKQKITSPFLGKCFDGSVLGNLVQKTNAMYSGVGFATTQVTVPKQNVVIPNPIFTYIISNSII
jgi:hemolysin activation/secretion protein